ncbi:MAG: septal ring lytic transglycosylase RlpA family protein, partial [Symploca sp. SIO2E6]|nr:septal ring lytic transglycosylase RlpA family protein [Symploca sp. SIO2E6]
SIPLNGFQLHEAQPLTKGFRKIANNPQAVLQAVLHWTNGQPFITQKLCYLILYNCDYIEVGEEENKIEYLVQTQVIANWESQDNPEHLRTIRDRILNNEKSALQLLGFYQIILQQGEIIFDNSPEQLQLSLSGLVINEENNLIIYNLVYRSVFNQHWLNKSFRTLRPYAEEISAWIASDYQDESCLLRGQKLQRAQKWSANKDLSPQDYNFLNASEKLARQKKWSNFQIITFILGVILTLGSTAFATFAINKYQYSQKLEKDLAALESHIAALNNNAAGSNNNIAALEKNIAALENELAEFKDNMAALENYSTALEKELADSEKELAVLIKDQVKESNAAYKKYISRIEQVKENDRKESLYRKLGRTLFANKKYDRAIEIYKKSYQLAKHNNSKEGIIESMYYLGHAYKALNNDTKAKEYYHKGEKELVDSYYSQYLTQGKASFSGSNERGQITASLEKFDPAVWTAAHRDLPFGTRVRVTNPKTGLPVVVRINNRGPARKTRRIINLSESAAQEIGLTEIGIMEVKLDPAGD